MAVSVRTLPAPMPPADDRAGARAERQVIRIRRPASETATAANAYDAPTPDAGWPWRSSTTRPCPVRARTAAFDDRLVPRPLTDAVSFSEKCPGQRPRRSCGACQPHGCRLIRCHLRARIPGATSLEVPGAAWFAQSVSLAGMVAWCQPPTATVRHRCSQGRRRPGPRSVQPTVSYEPAPTPPLARLDSGPAAPCGHSRRILGPVVTPGGVRG
jgi:hypothetical protein